MILYTVFVGGLEVTDGYLSKEDADKVAERYKDDGYDDVKIAPYSILGIDVETKDKKKLIRRLAQLRSTVAVEDGGVYHQQPEVSQVWLTTFKTIEELDDWLYATKGIDYVGTFERFGK